MKNTWQGYAVAVLVSLILGSTGSYLMSSSRIDEVEEDLETAIEKVEVREQKNFEMLLDMAKTLVRLEEQIKYLRESLDDH